MSFWSEYKRELKEFFNFISSYVRSSEFAFDVAVLTILVATIFLLFCLSWLAVFLFIP